MISPELGLSMKAIAGDYVDNPWVHSVREGLARSKFATFPEGLMLGEVKNTRREDLLL
jgi:hypothetical protein